MMCLVAYYGILVLSVVVVALQAIYAEIGEEAEANVGDELKARVAYAA